MREEGYYWVKLKGSFNWIVLYWNSVSWYKNSFVIENGVSDDCFSEINEERIKPPNETKNKWGKLNKELEDALEYISNEEFDRWYNDLKTKKK